MFSFSQTHATIPKKWILLDSQSTVDVFCNRQLLKNIRKGNTKMTIHCNAGKRTTTLRGDLEGYGEVWFDPNGIANVLSLSRVRRKYQVEYQDGTEGGMFVVTKPNGKKFIFKESQSGLHYLDTTESLSKEEKHEEKNTTENLFVVNTVQGNKSRFTNNDYL